MPPNLHINESDEKNKKKQRPIEERYIQQTTSVTMKFTKATGQKIPE